MLRAPREHSECVTDDGLRLIVRPNRTLTVRDMRWLFVGLAAVVLTIGIGFSVVGAWPVLPFAGLELLLVGFVLYRLYRHVDDHEQIRIEGGRVDVHQRRGGYDRHAEFQRYWTKVRLVRRGWYPSRLTLGSHGRFVEIASDVNEATRESLWTDLKKALWKSR